jgi:hypothetical protein
MNTQHCRNDKEGIKIKLPFLLRKPKEATSAPIKYLKLVSQNTVTFTYFHSKYGKK